MELSPPQEADSFAATQELTSILWIPKVHKSPSMVLTLSQINPVQTTPFSLKFILILATHLRLGHPSYLFPSGCPYSQLKSCIKLNYISILWFEC
jgi:hypothetical protein